MEKELRNYTVYIHTTPSGKVYIGITSNVPEYRWNNGKGYKTSSCFYNAIKKYGWENIKHEILYSGLTKEEAEKKEILLIKLYRADDRHYGYNLMSGGHASSKHSEETKAKLSKAHSGKNNWNYGRKHTPEECMRISENRTYKRGNEHPSAKAIMQFDRNGNLIKEWGSIADAGREYNRTSIKDCLKGKYKIGCGYVWKYKEK